MDEKYKLAVRCVDVPQSEVVLLHDMTGGATEITFETFARRTEWKDLARQMGYETTPGVKGLRLCRDRCVSFYRSKWKGKPCYYMVHSAIEFIFTKGTTGFVPARVWN